MVAPRLINITPGSGSGLYTGGDIVTITGYDIDAGATVDVRPFLTQSVTAAAVTKYVSFPNGIQHISVAMPAVSLLPITTPAPPTPFMGSVAKDTALSATLRVTNPPYGESTELLWSYDYRFIALVAPPVGNTTFEVESVGVAPAVIKQTYEFVADASGDVIFPTAAGGTIGKVILESDTATATWVVIYEDEAGIDAFHGAPAGPAPGADVEFIPVIGTLPVVVADKFSLKITGAGAGGTGRVHVYLTR